MKTPVMRKTDHENTSSFFKLFC